MVEKCAKICRVSKRRQLHGNEPHISQNNIILEPGCGDGRYTIPIPSQYQHILAIDLTIDSLRNPRLRGQTTNNIVLIPGDITTIKVTTSFDRVLSTLISNLPTREHRNSMYRLAVSALKPDVRFVISAHNHGFLQKLHRETKCGRYKPGGIYRYNFTIRECRLGARPFFKVVDARPIRIFFSFARTLQLLLITMSRYSSSKRGNCPTHMSPCFYSQAVFRCRYYSK